MAQGANTTAETTSEPTVEVSDGLTAPSSAVEVGLPVESLIVIYPGWIAYFPPGCGRDKACGSLNHPAEKKVMWHNVERPEVNANVYFILHFHIREQVENSIGK